MLGLIDLDEYRNQCNDGFIEGQLKYYIAGTAHRTD